MEKVPLLYLLSAPRGAGKTAFCRELAEQARAAGWDVTGLLSPAVFENGKKTGILAENLRTNESRMFAVSATQSPFANYNLPLGQWLFDPAIIAWGNEILKTCLPCDLFIVDELGPFELIGGQGWVTALEALRQSSYRVGLVVIRPELVETARQIFPDHEIVLLDPLSINAQEFFSTLKLNF